MPGPKASLTSTNASRWDRFVGSDESSGMPNCTRRNGVASTSRNTVPSPTASQGRLDIRLAKRPQNVVRGSTSGSSLPKGRRNRSIFPPANPSSIGSIVEAATIIVPTPMAAARPRVCTNGMGTNTRPRRATHTVRPANSDALPAEAMARPTASWGSCPSAMKARYRVMISSE